MHGLDEYDSEARWYYPAIMRTTTIDPMAEKYYSISPYAWCGNNPVRYVDPFGMSSEDANEDKWGYGKKDMWGRNTHDSFTHVYIPPMNRPGGISATGYGDSRYGYFSQTLTGYSANYWSVSWGGFTGYHFEEFSPIYKTEWIWYSQEERMYGMPKLGGGEFISTITGNINSFLTNTSIERKIANGITCPVLTGKSLLINHLAKEFIAGGNAEELFDAAARLNKVTKPFKAVGSALGVVSVVEHGFKLKDAIISRDAKGIWINAAKLSLDITFMALKSNPVVLGASIIYNTVDGITENY